ncbi:MAG: 16S rRNA (guanine(527)-N(7))-methyltransferase RsmG [Saprospiraceae bacterium]|nr:16S rRNA (guanine(527)-N(7))-methyltransferase RsmG [Saprospiraceae bacterium]
MNSILKYFPNLSEKQQAQFAQLPGLYKEWNEQINVISRKDIDNLEVHHVLHSLSIARLINFKPGSRILDLGTGGGFPGIPLAILFPEVQFSLIDARGKKIKVVNAVAGEIGLKNVEAKHIRAEELIPKKEKNKDAFRFDFVITRAVASLDQLIHWSTPLIQTKDQHALPNGLIALKGGNLKAEIKAIPKGTYSEVTPIHKLFPEPFFEEKYLVYVQR